MEPDEVVAIDVYERRGGRSWDAAEVSTRNAHIALVYAVADGRVNDRAEYAALYAENLIGHLEMQHGPMDEDEQAAVRSIDHADSFDFIQERLSA